MRTGPTHTLESRERRREGLRVWIWEGRPQPLLGEPKNLKRFVTGGGSLPSLARQAPRKLVGIGLPAYDPLREGRGRDSILRQAIEI